MKVRKPPSPLPLVAASILLGVLVLATGGTRADEAGWFADARYRFEWVDEQSFDEDATASTLRSRLAYRTPRHNGFELLAELSNIVAIGADDYNAGAGATPNRTRFPVVADPEDTRLARAWLAWTSSAGTRIQAGRQRIKLDDDRFVGNVGWRQNEQTYDGVTLRRAIGDWSLFYGWVGRVNRIFASDLDAGRHDHRTHLLNFSRDLASGHRLATYLYQIEDREQPSLSNRTLGLRYAGRTEWGERPVRWLAEAALQSDAGDAAPVDYSAGYFRVEVGTVLASTLSPRIGFERLGGSRRPGRAFRTPLATLHAFNGWADRFLVTPDGGLDDLYAGLGGRAGRLTWQLTAHEFRAEAGGDRYGRELDASLVIPLFESTSLLIKAARFESDSAAFRDVTKVWTQLSVAWP
ncbi:alginate export family protein [Halomonas denitrificans]|nr:alginate export family protein [Halomonas denitrificans]